MHFSRFKNLRQKSNESKNVNYSVKKKHLLKIFSEMVYTKLTEFKKIEKEFNDFALKDVLE